MIRLEKPSLELNTTTTSPGLSNLGFVAALPDGEAVVRYYISQNRTDQVLKISSQGNVTQVIYTYEICSSSIWGILVLGGYLYIAHVNGTLIETRVSDGRVLSRINIPNVIHVIHRGSLSNKPGKIPDKQTLVLCDYMKGEVFTFKPSTRQKQVRVTGLSLPTSVSYFFYNHTVYYIVCESSRHRITVYNHKWQYIRSIGTQGSNDGQLNYPSAALVSDEDTIIVTDELNRRVSEFTVNGTFLRHPIVRSDGIDSPFSMSYYYPYLWLIYDGKLYRYNLYV